MFLNTMVHVIAMLYYFRTFDRALWTEFFSFLLNWSANDTHPKPDLSAVARPLLDHLMTFSNVKFSSGYDRLWSQYVIN